MYLTMNRFKVKLGQEDAFEAVWTGRDSQLKAVPGSGTRPITDRVKEALFNILGAEIEGARVLDLFAGTGALGLEALSRGAREAVFVDDGGKADGGREAFSEVKLRHGMLKALEKRPVETRQVERSIRALLREISTVEDSEIPSSLLGEWVMRELAKLDEVAYIRFASVYKRFEDVQAFRELIDRLEREPPGEDDRRQISLLDPGRKGSRDS